MYSLAPFLFSLDAERAHGLGLSALDLAYRTGTTPLLAARIAPMPSTVFGLTFPIRSAWPLAWTRTASTSTHCSRWVSASSRSAPSPRARRPATRSRACSACRNTTRSSTAWASTMRAWTRWCNVERAQPPRLLGINIGKNKDTPNEQAVDDYIACLDKVYPLADSPSTSPRPTLPACVNCGRKPRCASWSASCATARKHWPRSMAAASRCW